MDGTSMFEMLIEQSRLILTGIFISFISKVIYKTTPTGFMSLGKYRTKEGAVFIYLFATCMLGFFTPVVYILSGFIIDTFSLLSIIGIIFLCSIFIINQSVPTWKHTTPKTLVMYGSAALLFVLGIFLPLIV